MFDPAQPANNSALSSAVMRSQLTSLLALIQAIPQGPPGPPGPEGQQGPPFAQALIDAVNTLNPGDPASVSVSFDGSNVHFTFGIPRGNNGTTGPQGPPFAQAVVDGVTTLNPGESAWVTVSFDGTNVHFTYGIPRGAEGVQGAPGQPGEVTTAQLTSAILGTALNPASVSPLSQAADSSYNQTQMQQVMDKLDEVLAALKRV